MNKHQRATTFVLVTLAAGLLTAVGLYLALADRSGTALIAGCVLAAAGLVVMAVRVTARLRAGRKDAQFSGLPPRGAVHALSLSQWMALLVGLTLTATGTAALTGVRMLGDDRVEAAAAAPTTAPTVAPPAPTTAAAATTTPAGPSPTPSLSPSVEASAADPSAAPAPGSITYLDSAHTIAGYYQPKAVTFSAPVTRAASRSSAPPPRARSCSGTWPAAPASTPPPASTTPRPTPSASSSSSIFYDQDGHQLVPKPVETSVGHPTEDHPRPDRHREPAG